MTSRPTLFHPAIGNWKFWAERWASVIAELSYQRYLKEDGKSGPYTIHFFNPLQCRRQDAYGRIQLLILSAAYIGIWTVPSNISLPRNFQRLASRIFIKPCTASRKWEIPFFLSK